MNLKAFTLIELVVWITISMMLMVSVGIFVNNWMANIIIQQKVIENTGNLTDFTSDIHTSINLMNSWTLSPIKTLSWILFKREKDLWNWWFSYIWTITSPDLGNWDWIYCESGSELINTTHLIQKNFIPFEEQNEDMFSNYESILTWSITWYISDQKNHIIIDESTWIEIIWKWIFWDKFIEWSYWTWIYLNSPTWLARYIDPWVINLLFISDTLNNRILYYDITEKKIYILLDETDWLNEPTWLYFTNKSLYIANSWNGEILKYSSPKITSIPNLDISFTNKNTNKIEIIFGSSNLENTWTFNISWYTWDKYLTGSTNTLMYYFISKAASATNINCNWKSNLDIVFDTSELTKPIVYCTSNWSWQIVSYPKQTISSIDVNGLTDFTGTWITYSANLKLYDDLSEILNEYHTYFTQWDEDLRTKDDNILEIIDSWLNYPTWIWFEWTNIRYKSFNKNITPITWILSNRDIPNKTLDYHSTDTVLETPISKFDVHFASGLVTLYLKYYKKYNCYNTSDVNERTYLFKKNIK